MRSRSVGLCVLAAAAAGFGAALAFSSPSPEPLPRTLPHLVRRPPPKAWVRPAAFHAPVFSEEIRSLHARGIKGRGMGIAIVDQCLLTEHREYAARLRWYDEIDAAGDDPGRWHGTAVASIAAGERTGVAPEADLYFVGIGANWAGEPVHGWFLGLKRVLHSRTQLSTAIRRILEMNHRLPADRKIRAISISIGWGMPFWGRELSRTAVDGARREGVFVSALDLGPEPFGPVVVASPGGPDEYFEHKVPAGSWWIAHTAGRYLLAAQEDPAMTPARFTAERLRKH